jgi:hypothetical protein
MPYYRLYLLDRSGSISHSIDFDAHDDHHAIEKAGAMDHGSGYSAMELWHLSRVVKRWPLPG